MRIPNEVKKAIGNESSKKDTAKNTGKTVKNGAGKKGNKKPRRATSEERKKFFDLVKEQLGDLPAVGFWGNKSFVDSEDYIFEGRHFKILPVRVMRVNEENGKFYKRRTGFYMAFDMDRIQPNSNVTIKVPEGKERMFCGSGAWQVADASRKLGVAKVRVEKL